MIKFNETVLKDKIYACWLGKNIGGTIGTPYEGRRQVNDITGFTSEKGAPLANDDLDLQLIWLKAVKDVGIKGITNKVLGEYWIDYITPFWNEYGICKSNMKAGLIPPLSGQYRNEWKDSNGAWIRTEIWACITPGMPNETIKYAYADASVDHGMTGEGTYAAIFVAAVESAAFVISDIRKLIDIGLSKIPKDCRVAKSINLVLNAYDKGLSWLEARNIVTDDILKDLGWFQAPANVAYAIIGLLYGEGDFKKTIITAVNCGDDTDCTAATVGSILGIINGTKIIPNDWKEYIGDDIITVAVNRGNVYVPSTCTKLTEDVIYQTKKALFGTDVMVCDGDDEIADVPKEYFEESAFIKELTERSEYSFEKDFIISSVIVEYDGEPNITENGNIEIKLTIKNKTPSQKHFSVRFLLPEGWTVEGNKNVPVQAMHGNSKSEKYKITANDKVQAKNRAIIEITSEGRMDTGLIDLVIFG